MSCVEAAYMEASMALVLAWLLNPLGLALQHGLGGATPHNPHNFISKDSFSSIHYIRHTIRPAPPGTSRFCCNRSYEAVCHDGGVALAVVTCSTSRHASDPTV
jgi:hypothetical protein